MLPGAGADPFFPLVDGALAENADFAGDLGTGIDGCEDAEEGLGELAAVAVRVAPPEAVDQLHDLDAGHGAEGGVFVGQHAGGGAIGVSGRPVLGSRFLLAESKVGCDQLCAPPSVVMDGVAVFLWLPRECNAYASLY